MSISVAAAVELALLAAFAAAVAWRSRRAPSRASLALLGCIAAAGLLTHLDGVRAHANGRVHVHPTEFYHYYLGTRYFAECGYYGLYEAATVAEHELDPEGFRPDETLRHLRNPAYELRKADVLARAEEIRARFTPERWQEFRDDVAFLRSFDLRHWGTSPPERDHGYNGTPATTALLGGLARASGLSAAGFVPAAAWLDLAFLLGLVVAIGVALRWELAFAFLALWSLNPLNDYAFTGGAYLRHAHFVALALALVLLARRRLLGGGAALAVATALRILPGFFAAAAVAHDLVNARPLARLRAHRALYLGGVLGLLLVAAATWPVRAPDGSNAWVSFGERIARHADNWSPNRIGLDFLLAYSADHELVPAAGTPPPRGPAWRSAMQSTLESRRSLRLAAIAAILAASLLYLRRVPFVEAPFAGFLWLFAFASPSHYDYALLGAIPLVFSESRGAWLALACAEAALLLLGASDAVTRSPDRAHAVYGAAVGIFLLELA